MTTTIDRPPRLVLDLNLDTAPHPEQHWEGRLDLAGDKFDLLTLLIVAQLRFVSGLIEGEGVMTAEGHEQVFPSSLSGEVLDGGVSIAIWIHEPALARFKLLCTGELSADAQRIDGSLFSPCGDPETCNCGGTSGTFSLWRVGDGGRRAAG